MIADTSLQTGHAIQRHAGQLTQPELGISAVLTDHPQANPEGPGVAVPLQTSADAIGHPTRFADTHHIVCPPWWVLSAAPTSVCDTL